MRNNKLLIIVVVFVLIISKYFASKNQKDRLICIQNENDNHGTYENIKIFLNEIDSEIKTLSNLRNIHDYTYPEEFINFLAD